MEIRILHVDDGPDFVDMVATFLERENEQFRVSTATSASDGLDQLAADGHDCIVSDYDMPGRNGIELLQNVREEYPDLPFILYTGKGSEEVASEAISNGATDYLQKGSGSDHYELLANRIKNAVERHRSSRQAANLERIRQLVSDVNQALVRATSPDEIETRVCRLISDSDPYVTACIADVNRETMEIEPRAWAGGAAGYFEQLDMTVGEESPGRHAPGGRAFHDREIAVSQNIQDDDRYATWREAALERGFQSLAVVPVEYEDELHGLLATFASRPNAFTQTERELLVELADDIGNALHNQQIQTELEEAERRYQSLLNDPNFLAGILTTDGTLVEQNRTGMEYIDTEIEDVVGEPFWETPWWPEELQPVLREKIKKAASGEYVAYEADLTKPNGAPYSVSGVIRPVTDDDEQVVSLVVSARDVTDRKERERAITELHQATDELMDASAPEEVPDTVSDTVTEILDIPVSDVRLYDEEDGRPVPVAWTEQTEETAGEPPIAVSGEEIAGTALESDETLIHDGISTTSDRYNLDTPVRSQIAFPLADHGVIVVDSPDPDAFDDTDVSLAEIFAAHITTALDQFEREGELESEQLFIDQALDTLRDVVYIIGADGDLRRWNDQLSRVTGYPDDELTEMCATEFFPEDEREEIADAIEETLTTGESIGEADLLTADGKRIPYEFTGTRLTDTEGETVGLVGIGRDISDRKQREQALKRKNERLDEFASVVSHDLRNPLNVAEGRLELAHEECDSEHLTAVADAHDRMDSLIEDLLTLAQEGDRVGDLEAVDLAELSETCWQNVETANATVRAPIDRSIRSDRSRLAQLLENLIRNAAEHGGDGVTVTIGELDSGFYVEDDGPGIPEDDRGKPFDAGYSTAETGAGFGLSIVKQVAEAHGWNVHLTGGTDGGARFEITGVDFAV